MSVAVEEEVSARLDEVQDSTVGFTGHEWAYLLSLNPTEAATETAEVFRLGPSWSDDATIAIGAAGLLVRGLVVSEDGSTIVPVGAASWAGALGTLATRWTEFAVVTDTFTEASILIEADGGRALVQPRALGTWWFTPLAPAASRGEVHGVVLRALEAVEGPIGITVRSATMGTSETLTARRVGKLWSTAIGITGAEQPTIQQDELTHHEVESLVTSWLDGPGLQ